MNVSRSDADRQRQMEQDEALARALQQGEEHAAAQQHGAAGQQHQQRVSWHTDWYVTAAQFTKNSYDQSTYKRHMETCHIYLFI